MLARVPGSFLSEKIPHGCPTNYPPDIAAYELVEKLLPLGHAGQWLVFGYGRSWHAIGETPKDARASLRMHFRWQLAHPRCVPIVPDFLATAAARDYLDWKRNHVPGRRRGANYMAKRLSTLWQAPGG